LTLKIAQFGEQANTMTSGDMNQSNQFTKLSIVVPIYNEARTLRKIFKTILATSYGLPIEVVAVDDHSRDGSKEILRQLALENPCVKPIFHATNQGKGAAVHTAIEYVTGDIVVIQDADLEYDPADIPRVIKPILDGRADACFGSRFAGSECRRVLYFWHSVANYILTLLTNIVSDLNLTDMETCYKAVKASIIKQIPLKLKRFGIEPELTIRLAQWGARIYEVPISYSGRTYAEGKKITWKDGVLALFAIIWAGIINRRFTTHDGFYALKVMGEDDFNKWMFSKIKRSVGQRVLEAGCGVGNLSKFLIDRECVVSVDIDRLYVELIGRRFGHLENFHSEYADLATLDERHFSSMRLDTIVCLNVLEHIEDDCGVLKKFLNVLEPGGNAIILVPQHSWLYCGIDQSVGHYRRYSKQELVAKARAAGFKITAVQEFNRLGVLGWWLNGKVLKREHLSNHQVKLFGLILPIVKMVEWCPLFPSLSTIIVAEKPITPSKTTLEVLAASQV
jgi:glycosyltransferase involved in cell wall biosynthesis